MLVSLPKTLTNGTTAFGSDVKANDDAIVGVVNGGVDNDNMRTGADAAGKGLSTDKIANSAITTVKIADGNVTAVKLAVDNPLGNGANLSALYSGAGDDNTNGYPRTNINGGRRARGGCTVWGYFGFLVADIGVNFKVDNSIDWTDRMITIIAEGTIGVATPKDNIPGGTSDHLAIAFAFWTGPGNVGTGGNGGMFFAENGQNGTLAPGAGPAVELAFGPSGNYIIRLFVGDGTGGTILGTLYVRPTTINTNGLSINAMFTCSPVMT